MSSETAPTARERALITVVWTISICEEFRRALATDLDRLLTQGDCDTVSAELWLEASRAVRTCDHALHQVRGRAVEAANAFNADGVEAEARAFVAKREAK